MIDNSERELWFHAYLIAAERYAPASLGVAEVRAWAWSMALIAEQMMDADDADTQSVD